MGGVRGLLLEGCCCDIPACCQEWTGGWSCGSTFSFSVDWTSVFYEREPTAPCGPKYPSVSSCDAVDCDLCVQETDASGPDPHCRYWSLSHPTVGTMGFDFTICANSTGISSAPYHMSIGDGLDPLCECNDELIPCDCSVLLGDDCCSAFNSYNVLQWCGDTCVGTPGEAHTAGNDILKLVDGHDSYTDDSLVITSTSGTITAKVTLCNRYVSPGDAALFPDNKDFFPGLPSTLTSCAFVQRRDLETGGCETRLNWVHINVTRGDNSYDYYCYGTANKYAEWANANIPNIVVTGNNFWFGLRLPFSAISKNPDENGGCVYEPTRYCQHVQSEYRLDDDENPEFMPDNSDDWILQSTSSTEIKWKCRAAYWYKTKLTIDAENRYGGTNSLTTTSCGYNLPYCSGCENCGTSWSRGGTCTDPSGPCGQAVPPSTTYTECGLGPCLDQNNSNTCDPIIGCCNSYECAGTNPCSGSGPYGKVGAVFQATDYIPSLFGQALMGWSSWTLVSNYIYNNAYCKPVTIQGGGYPT